MTSLGSKRHPISALVLLSVWSVLPATLASPQANELPRGVPRFHQVAEGFYRGGQPKREGFEFLKRQGIRTVINLRSENDEESVVKSLGFKYVHIPMRSREHVPDEKIQEFFRVLRDPLNYPVFVHCQRGADRTGFMVALYRIAFQGWDAEKANEEARTIGMRWWYRGLRRQLYEFAERQGAAAGTNPSPQ